MRTRSAISSQNKRLQGGQTESDLENLREFSKWILNVGDGTIEELLDGKYFEERTILAPTLEVVEKVNDYIMSLLPGEEKNEEDLYSVEHLNSIKLSGIPNHCLRLKVSVHVMLLQNIDQSSGLCNGTRLVATRLMTHIIEAVIISGMHIRLLSLASPTIICQISS
ncbi:hypothetical protein V2J09_009187 [Rumex salicifolius]